MPALRRRAVEEVPDENGVVVRAADKLELVELEAEDAAGVLDERAYAEGAGGCPRVEGGCEVPDLDLAVVGAADDALFVEADAADELLVAL